MRQGAAIACLALICLAAQSPASEAKVLLVGQKVKDRPVTFAASDSLLAPKRLVLTVVPRPSAPVEVEWFLLCMGSPGPINGDEFVVKHPVRRRLELPKGPRGVCLFDSKANYVDRKQSGRINLKLRGRSRHVPGLPGSTKSR